MNPQYLKQLEQVLRLARPELPGSPALQFKPSFGGVAGYLDGRIFASCGKFGLALKLPPERCAGLIADRRGAPLRYFAKCHLKKSYVVLPEGTLGNRLLMAGLVQESLAFASRTGS